MRTGPLLTLAALGATGHCRFSKRSDNGLPVFLGDHDSIPDVEPIMIPSDFGEWKFSGPWMISERPGDLELPSSPDDSQPSENRVTASDSYDKCSPEPLGSGPRPSNDTAGAFRSFQDFADAAGQAVIPEGYERVKNGTALTAAVASVSFQGASIVDKYDPESCAAICNKNPACIAFNIYFERDPTRAPDIEAGCGNPPSTTNIKCVFWGNYLTGAMARNQGEMREHFEVAIAGSNIYNKKGYSSDLAPIGFKSTSSPAGVLVVPDEPVGHYNTFLGSKRFDYAEGWSFNPSICAHECNKQTEAGSRKSSNPPAPFSAGGYPKCVMFQAFEVHRGGLPTTMVCANYMSAWDPEAYATWTEDVDSSGTRVEAKIAEVYIRTDYRFPPICAEKSSCAGRFYKGGDCSGWGADHCLFDPTREDSPSADATTAVLSTAQLSESLPTGPPTPSTQANAPSTLSQAFKSQPSTLGTQVRPVSTSSEPPSINLSTPGTPSATLPGTLLAKEKSTPGVSRTASATSAGEISTEVRTVVWQWVTLSYEVGTTLLARQAGTPSGSLTTPTAASASLVGLNTLASSASPRLETRII